MPGRRHRSPDWAGPPDVLARLRATALDAQALLLDLDPVLGEPSTQRAVDDYVEHAADALRALAEVAEVDLAATQDGDTADRSGHVASLGEQSNARPDGPRPVPW